MVNIGSIIRRELVNKETFYLPGLGMLEKEYIPAYFDEVKQIFIPPTQAFLIVDHEFDTDALTEFITGNHDLSLTESKKVSSSIINSLEDCIATKGDVHIEGLGNCSVKRQEELLLIPEEEKSQFSFYDSIAEFDILPARETEHGLVEENTSSADSVDGVGEQVDEAIVETPIDPIPSNDLDDLESERDSKRWLWSVIGVAICVIAGGIWFLNPRMGNKTELSYQSAATQATETNADSVSAPTTQNAVDEATDTSTAAGASVSATNPDEVIREPSGRYEIIIAAFETMAEAKDFVAKTNAKGYNVYILQNNRPGNMNKISYASFNTSAEASASLSRVREELAREAWLWENKNYNINNQN